MAAQLTLVAACTTTRVAEEVVYLIVHPEPGRRETGAETVLTPTLGQVTVAAEASVPEEG